MIKPRPLTSKDFAPFGQIIEMKGEYDFTFNEGRADRWADLANLEVDKNGRLGVSLCVSRPVILPYEVQFVERHPLASQAFIPLNQQPFLVIVAHDEAGKPSSPEIFITNGQQGVNYARGTWHGVLSPLDKEQSFLIIDRISGKSENLEVYFYKTPVLISFH